jgi:hypothetical protein
MIGPVDPNRVQRFHAEPSRAGSIALFTEHRSIGCVRVVNVKTDDWGVRVTIERLAVPGIGPVFRDDRDSCELSCCWQLFSSGDDHWYAPYAAWNLRFEPGLLEALTAAAAQAAARGELLSPHQAIVVYRELRSARMKLQPG